LKGFSVALKRREALHCRKRSTWRYFSWLKIFTRNTFAASSRKILGGLGLAASSSFLASENIFVEMTGSSAVPLLSSEILRGFEALDLS
jgi:hypothetical protein